MTWLCFENGSWKLIEPEEVEEARRLGFQVRQINASLRDFTIEQMEEEIEWRRYHATNFEKEVL